jgi:NAD+ kinase
VAPLEHTELLEHDPSLAPLALLGSEIQIGDLELTIVLGGDGTILRAAEITRGCLAPLLGVNLGHVGFLAESDREDLTESVARALARDYLVEERMTLSVRVKVNAEVIYETWALNEATVEKASRERISDSTSRAISPSRASSSSASNIAASASTEPVVVAE